MFNNSNQARSWQRSLAIITTVVVLLFVFTATGLAITYGEPDGDDHPNVGSVVIRLSDGRLFQWCSGTLIADDVFLTVSHCTAPLDGILADNPGAQVLVTFDPTINESATFYTGVWRTNPNYNAGAGQPGASDTGDVAVIIFDKKKPPKNIARASLPPAGMLDELQADGVLMDTRFTAVGYGTIRDSKKTGWQGILDNLDRNRVEQGFQSLTKAWLTLNMRESNDNGGGCFGDSGGPHFIHLNGEETDIVASITVTGDSVCKATDKTYRMDSESARNFLDEFVDLP